MKKLVVKNISECAACRTCEAACAEAYYKCSDISLAALKVRYTEPVTISVCTQCGKCAAVCPMEAITQNKLGVYMIDRKKCVGCLACMDICPNNIIVKEHDTVYATKCTACGICVKACPKNVLEVVSE